MDLFRPSTLGFQNVDARDIGERNDAVLRTATRGHDNIIGSHPAIPDLGTALFIAACFPKALAAR
jgi:hypothetical protein